MTPNTTTSKTSKQQLVYKYFTNDKITITITKGAFKKYIIDLVVKNGAALSLLESPAFWRLNGEMAKQFNICLERHNIRNMVVEEAKNEKNIYILKEMLQGKLLFIKMDPCTRQRVNYMAINIQFIDDQNNLAICTLAMRDTKTQHSSDYIKKLTESILFEYVTKDQVLAIVTNNASNMTSAVQKLNEEDEEEDPFEVVNDEDIEIVDDMVATAVNNFVGFAKYPIEHMRCAEHTLQLAIQDGLNDNRAANAIARYWKLVT